MNFNPFYSLNLFQLLITIILPSKALHESPRQRQQRRSDPQALEKSDQHDPRRK